MKLINVKDFGYGIDGHSLNLTILIPKNCYLKTFLILNHKEIEDIDDISESYIPIPPYKERGYKDASDSSLFLQYFKYIKDVEIDGEEYSLYSTYKNRDAVTGRIIVPVDPNDLSFICMEVAGESLQEEAVLDEYSCSEKKEVFPLFDSITLEIKALDAAKSMECCDYPRAFIDKILQIKAIKMSLLACEFYRAATYWKKFYDNEEAFTGKNCNCNG